jgi:hypothetical protein
MAVSKGKRLLENTFLLLLGSMLNPLLILLSDQTHMLTNFYSGVSFEFAGQIVVSHLPHPTFAGQVVDLGFCAKSF